MSSRKVTRAWPGVYSKKNANKEIERKFLVVNVPNLGSYPSKEILQAYILKGEGLEIRVRREGDSYYQTIKKGSGLVRDEFETSIRKKDFDILRTNLGSGREVIKTRYYVPHKGNTIYVDVYKGMQKGLVVAEVEFTSAKKASEFAPPSWLGKELTGDTRYNNSTLAIRNSGSTLLRRMPRNMQLDEGVEYLKSSISDIDSKQGNPLVVLVAGGSASGKTSMVARKAYDAFNDRAVLISMDDYYKGAKYLESEKAKGNEINFDHPDSIDIPLLRRHLKQLKSGKGIKKPIYDFKTCERAGTERIEPKKIIILEGLFALSEEIAKGGDIRVYVDTGVHGRIIRRLLRDSTRSSWTPVDNMRYIVDVAEPMYKKYISTTKTNADLIISNEYNPKSEAARSNVNEIQVKYKIDIDESKLQQIGAERIISSVQIDRYYAFDSVPFGETDEMLRVRNESGKVILAYKGPRSKNAERPKFEFEIDPELERKLLSVYSSESKSIEKTRTVYRYKDLIFSVDSNVSKTVEGKKESLGNFMELRFKGNNFDEAATNGLFEKLEIPNPPMTLKSYYDM